MSDILYSIIVPVYGVEDYLTKCVESIIEQSYRNIEIILVDDGSKDQCPLICDEFERLDSRIRVIHKSNGGLVSARKEGAKHTKGDYVICVDGDDWISKDYVQTINEVVTEYCPDLVCCGLVKTDGKKELPIKLSIASGYYDSERVKEYIYPIAIESKSGGIFSPQLCSKAIKRELYINEQLSLSNDVCIGEDGAVVKPILTKCSTVYVVDRNLYYYRLNMSSLTKRRDGYDWDGPELIYSHLRARIKYDAYDFSEQIDRKLAHDIYIVVVSWLRTGKPYRVILKEIRREMKRHDYASHLYNCEFTSVKIRLELFMIRHSIYLPIYVVSNLR